MKRWQGALTAGLLATAAWSVLPPDAQAAPKKAAKKEDPKKKDKKGREAKTPEKPKDTGRPGDQQATTKGLEEQLKKTEEPEAPTRLAPAKLPSAPGKEVTRDALADQRRDEAIEQIKKILPKQKDPNTRADLFFQLAELWWEKSKFVNIAEEMPAFDHEMKVWHDCIRDKGEKACPSEPRPNTRKSELYRKNAVDLYAQVVRDYPKYPRNDEVLYALAYNRYEMAIAESKKGCDEKLEKAVDPFRMLITQFPKSPLVCDAYVQLGNYSFDCNRLEPARKAFDLGAGEKCPKTRTYATYKLAWCDYNGGDFEAAIKRFKKVVEAGEKEGGDKIKLKTEALRDVVLSFEKIDALDSAVRYFKEKAGAQGAGQYIRALASLYFSAGKYDMAIKMYRDVLIKERPTDPNAPEWQSKIVLAYDKLNRRDEVLREMRTLVNNYKPGTPWGVANSTNRSATEMALSLTEEALYNLVTDYHQEAIKTKSVATYRLAEKIYREYVSSFPESERAYQMRYYWAEILYALEDFQNGYEQYLKVALDKERDEYKRQAAMNMLLSAEKLVKIEAGVEHRNIDSETQKIDEKKDKGTIEQKKLVKVDKTAKEQPLTDLEKQFIAACDKYTELIPTAADEAQVRLAAAVIYFDRVQYVEAARRFSYIIRKWPEEKTSSLAAQLILESLEVKEEWAALNRLAREFHANPKLLAGKDKDDFRKKLPLYIENSQFKYALEVNAAKDYPHAAKLFRGFVDEFHASPYAPLALYNAFGIFQRANELDTAIEVGEQLLHDYPRCDEDKNRDLPGGEKRPLLLPLLVFDLGKVYEKTADFATAARYYEQFARDFPRDPKAMDAQFNAGLWYQGLGDTDKALAAYQKYIDAYKKLRDPERAEIEKALGGTKLVPESAVFFTMARILEGRKEWKKAGEKLDEYVRVYKNEEAWKHQNARYRQMLALRELGKNADALKMCEELVKRNDGRMSGGLSEADKGQETSKLAAGHCRFMLLEAKFDGYAKMGFSSPRNFAGELKKKIAAMGELKNDYTAVVADGNGDWAIAALVRVAVLPKNFAKTLLDAPMPKGLDADQQEMYRALLEEEALKYEEPAITALETALAKSFELGIYNEWTLESEKMLAEFKPDLFGDIRELPLKGTEFFFTVDAVQAANAAPAASAR